MNERCVDTLTHSSARIAKPAATSSWPAGLAPLAQPEVAAPAHAEVVVDEADDRHRDDQHHQRDAGARKPDLLGTHVRDEVADERAPDDGDAAHRRRARLLHVRVRERAVVADLLADALALEDADEERRAEDAQEERDAHADEQGDHDRPPRAVTSAVATSSSPTARLAFTSTTSPPGTTKPRTASSAAAASAPR